MNADWRKINPNEVLPLFQKLDKKLKRRFFSTISVDVKQNEGEWFLNLYRGHWNDKTFFSLHGRNSLMFSNNAEQLKKFPELEGSPVSIVWFNYSPPNSGNVRFKGCASVNSYANAEVIGIPEAHEVITTVNRWLEKYGYSGKNLISNFEKL